jgi:hypothetical protein
MTSKPDEIPPDIQKELKDHRRQANKIAGFLHSGDYTKGPEFIPVFIAKRDGKLKYYLNAEIERKKRDRQRGSNNMAARPAKKLPRVRAAMLKHFTEVEKFIGCKLENATDDQLRKAYKIGTIASELKANEDFYFETKQGNLDGVSPYLESTLRDRVVREVLNQLIGEKIIPPEPPPRRARQR